MKYSLLIMLAFAVCSYGQPVDGPYVVINSDSAIHHIHVAARNDSIADVFWQVGNEAYHAAFSFEFNAVFAGPEAFPMAAPGYARILEDAIMTDEGWVAMVQDESPNYGVNRIARGMDQVEQERLIDAISHAQVPYFSFGSNSGARVFDNATEGFWTGWIAARCHPFAYGWECFGFPDLRHYTTFNDSPLDVLPCACWMASCFPLWAAVVDLSDDSTAVLYGGNQGVTISQLCSEYNLDGWGSNLDIAVYPLSRVRTPGDRQLVLGGHGECGGEIPPRIVEFDTSGQTTELLAIADDPISASSAPDYGFAWLSRPGNGLLLNRADTTGTLVHPAGVVYWPREGETVTGSNIAMTDGGKIMVVWTTEEVANPGPSQLWIEAVDWDTPLSANPPPERTAVRHYELSAYPNPFNNSVRISYDLPRAGEVELDIYDVLGRHVQTLWNQTMSAGTHSIVWTPDGTSGIYFIHLRAGDQTRVEKLMFIK